MSSELALVVIVALLWGPTALWLIIRFVRGPRESTRNVGMGDGTIEAPGPLVWPKPGVKELAELIVQDEYWVCEACRSINRPSSRRCYACRLKRGAALPTTEAPAPVPVMTESEERRAVGPGVPVEVVAPAAVVAAASNPAPPAGGPGQGDAAAPRPTAVPGPSIVVAPHPATVRSAGRTRQAPADPTPVAPEVPSDAAPGSRAGTMHAPGAAAASSSSAAAAPALTGAKTGGAPPATGVGVTGAPASPSGPAVVDAAVAVCPFVRLAGDPTTWYEFPHPGNLCHALVGQPTPLRGLGRLLGIRLAGRPAVTSPEVQASLCLTAAHVQCARYQSGRVSDDAPGGSSPDETPNAVGEHPEPAPAAGHPEPAPDSGNEELSPGTRAASAASTAARPAAPLVVPLILEADVAGHDLATADPAPSDDVSRPGPTASKAAPRRRRRGGRAAATNDPPNGTRPSTSGGAVERGAVEKETGVGTAGSDGRPLGADPNRPGPAKSPGGGTAAETTAERDPA